MTEIPISRIFTVSIDVASSADVGPEEVAARIEDALGERPLPDGFDFSKLVVRTIPHTTGMVAQGYDMRLWEKATC